MHLVGETLDHLGACGGFRMEANFYTGQELSFLVTQIGIVGILGFVCFKYPFPNHVVGKGVIKELRARHPLANIVAVDYDPGASEVNQLNRIKLMLSTAEKNLRK